MNARLNDAQDRINRLKIEMTPGTVLAISNILEEIIIEMKAIDARLEQAEGTARFAANTASCLANGIQPD